MRKVFLDCGAHMGETIVAFCNNFVDSSEYEIFSFEPSDNPACSIWINHWKSEMLEQNNLKDLHFYNKAVWIYDGQIKFKDSGDESSHILYSEYDGEDSSDTKLVGCVDLSNWIKNNFSKEDYIILKLDIEGSEYEVLKKIVADKTIDYIDKIYCEIHGAKVDKTFEETLYLVELLKSVGHNLHVWCAETYKLDKEVYYTKERVKREYEKWNQRGQDLIKEMVLDMRRRGVEVARYNDIELAIYDDGVVKVKHLISETSGNGDNN